MNGLANSRARNIVVLLATVWVLGSTAYGAPVLLTNGVPVSGLSGTIGSETFYAIVVPAGQDDLEIKISGGTGDCDLYVRRNAPPTMTTYDYRPYQVGNNETVTVAGPPAGTWYIMLRGYTAYSGLSLGATYSASISVIPLTNGLPLSGLAAPTGSEMLYKIDVPAGQTKLEIQISGGSGDCDLYVKRDALPTTAVYDYRPYKVDNNEKVTVDNPAGGSWYIMLRAYNAYAGMTLLASYSGGLGIALTNGVPVPNLSGTLGSETLYRIDMPAGQTNLAIQISGGSGDCDLYVKYGTPPTPSDFDYRPFTPGNEETVSINTPTAGAWYIMLRGYTNYAGLTLLASYGNVFTLENGVAVPDLSGVQNSEKLFKIDLPSGETEFEIRISGGSGNCDLYVRRGLRPTVSDWDYRPYLSGNNETVSLSNPQGGTWYILLRARQAYAGVTLYAAHAFVGNVTLLSNGVPVTNTAGVEGSKKYYRILVPSNQTEFEIKISGGTGDADLYVNHGDAVPTLTEYDYRPYQIGNNETATITDPPSGNWLIMVHAYHAYTGLTVVATYSDQGGGGGSTVTPLTNGVPVTALAGATGSQRLYQIDVPPGQSKLDIQMSGGTGDADMYVRKDQLPTLTEWDYRPYLVGNNEIVTINNPVAGTYFILLNAYQAYTGATLVASYVPVAETVIELDNGVPVTGLSGATGSETFYKIVVPAGQDSLDIQMSGGTGDADMYIKKGAKPTTTSWDYRPYLIGNDETVHLDNPAAATWYILIKSYQAYTGASLVATYGVTAVGNNFAVDPNCMALWRFEAGHLTADSLGIGTHTLVNHGVDANTVEYREGTASAKFVSGEYLSIIDANLAAGFPLKSTGNQKQLSVCCWVRVPDNRITTIWSKFATGQRSLQFALDGAGANVEVYLVQGYGAGLEYQFQVTRPGLTLNPMKWYHIGFTYDDATRTYRVRVWDAEAGVLVDTKTGTFTYNIALTQAPWQIGKGNWNNNGWIDEMVVFNDILSPAEIDKIRQGTYGKP